MLSGLLTVTLFIYILLIPVIKGIPPNVGISPLLARMNVDYGRMSYIYSIGPGVSQGSYPQSYPCVHSFDSASVTKLSASYMHVCFDSAT